MKDSGDIAEIILIQGSKYFTPLQSNLSSLVSSCCVLNVIMSANEKKEDTFHKKGNLHTPVRFIKTLTDRLAD